jgi:inosine-uridine nucleoside N-ribohydrolase
MPTKVILDVDTGTDDAVALMLAALHPEIELIGACSVNGNVSLDFTTENTLRVFDHIGVPVPVYRGLAKPLVREDFPVPRGAPNPGTTNVHGDYLDIPPATSTIQDVGAVEFLIETYRAATEEIVLIPVGPLTNIAAALRVEPRLAQWIPRTIIMGGAHRTGNLTPRAEFNIWADPEAAHVVFHAGLRDLTLVPLDATHKALVSLVDCAALRGLGTPAGEATATFVERRIRGYDEGQPMSRPGAAPVHDALCVAAVFQPDIITTEQLYVTVETHGEVTVGETVIDVAGRSKQPPNMAVAFDADEQAFVQILLETFAG